MEREKSKAFKRLNTLKQTLRLTGSLHVEAAGNRGSPAERNTYYLGGHCLGVSAPEARKTLRKMAGKEVK